MPCYDKRTGEYTGPKCEDLPVDRPCEATFRPCGCCPECALDVGAECNGMSPRCRKGLFCISESGVAKEEVAWHDHDYKGKCLPRREADRMGP